MNFYDIAADWGPHFMPLSRRHDAMTLDTHSFTLPPTPSSLSHYLWIYLFVCSFVHDANNQFNVFVTSHCWRARVKYLHSLHLPSPPSHQIRHFYLRKLTNWKWMEWIKKSENSSLFDTKTKEQNWKWRYSSYEWILTPSSSSSFMACANMMWFPAFSFIGLSFGIRPSWMTGTCFKSW